MTVIIAWASYTLGWLMIHGRFWMTVALLSLTGAAVSVVAGWFLLWLVGRLEVADIVADASDARYADT